MISRGTGLEAHQAPPSLRQASRPAGSWQSRSRSGPVEPCKLKSGSCVKGLRVCTCDSGTAWAPLRWPCAPWLWMKLKSAVRKLRKTACPASQDMLHRAAEVESQMLGMASDPTC